MSEQIRQHRERRGLEPSGLPDPFAPTDGLGDIVTVQRGLHEEYLPLGGMSVREIRRRFADRFDINPENQAFINGRPVDDESVVLHAGERLEFTRNAGEKGIKPAEQLPSRN